jgi:hypothetical protein
MRPEIPRAQQLLDRLLDDISGPLVDETREHFDVIACALRRPDVMAFIQRELAEPGTPPDPAPPESCVSACSECAHVFSAQELAKEDPEAWGHPCWGMAQKGVCESYRTPKVLADAVRPDPAPGSVTLAAEDARGLAFLLAKAIREDDDASEADRREARKLLEKLGGDTQ